MTPEVDALVSVTRESDAAIVTPRYTRSALAQMGWQRSFGAGRTYRTRFTAAFVDAWAGRFEALTGEAPSA